MRKAVWALVFLLMSSVAAADGKLAIFRLHPRDGMDYHGTCFFVSERLVLSAAHVVVSALGAIGVAVEKRGELALLRHSLFIKSADSKLTFSCRVIYLDTVNDIAILEADRAHSHFLRVSFELPRGGDRLYVLTAIEGVVVRVPLRCLHSSVMMNWDSFSAGDAETKVRVILSAWHLQGGCSGSPVMKDGKVIAIHVGSSKAFAISIPLKNLSTWGKWWLRGAIYERK